MGVNSLPKTVTGQRRGCDLNPGPTAPESSTLTTRLPSHTVGGGGANVRSRASTGAARRTPLTSRKASRIEDETAGVGKSQFDR